MDSSSTKTTIFSLTAPGVPILKGTAAAQLARHVNEYGAILRDSNPSRFGFFAALPCLCDDIEAALEEIRYSLDHLKADGITLYTRYGPDNHYLGHAEFRPIWAELNKRSAVVFIHPTHAVDTNLVNPILPQPLIDYPHETCRTAVDLVTSTTIRNHPECKIILSHAGGTLPFLADRVFTILPDSGMTPQTTAECWEDVNRFYYDLALASNMYTLPLLTRFAQPGHILFGSDFPFAPTKTIKTMTGRLNECRFSKENGLDAVNRGNALKLFPRLQAYM